MRTARPTLLLVFLALAWVPSAQARPLTLAELYNFGRYLGCVEKCGTVDQDSTYQQVVSYNQCLADNCALPPRLWEKNGIAPVDATDHWLALLEYQDSQDPTRRLVCYSDEDETIVVPGALCAGELCLQSEECTEAQCALPASAEVNCVDQPNTGKVCWWPEGLRPAACPDPVCAYSPARTDDDCADADGDGVPTWLEDQLGLDPQKAERLCDGQSPCSFDEACKYEPDYGTGLCHARDCPAGGCTAFHLDLVAQDDVQAIVHVHYDWTPIPARVLDLYIDYDGTNLVLEDSRALAPLVALGKELHTTHLSDGTLRLTVMDLGASHPIPTGPIIELVFRRVGDGATELGFSTEDQLQLKSVAPLQGTTEIQEELTDDELWGPQVALSPRAEVATQLLLWYGFKSLDTPLAYAAIPTAEDLCGLLASCANEPDEEERARLLARLALLQHGEVNSSEAIPGVVMDGIYLDGTSGHLRLPVNYQQPLAAGAQSFSWSAWFFAEGPSADEKAGTPQLLFTHNGFDERTRFGLKLVNEGNAATGLYLFDGDFLAKWETTEIPVVRGIRLRTWHHLGFSLDAATGEVFFYFDGLPVTAEPDGTPLPSYTFSQPPMAVACPQFQGGKDIKLHEEGDVLGGGSPEFIYYGVKRSGLHRIERTDPSGLLTKLVLGSGQANYRDPDYSPILDRLVYSCNVSGSYEIWIANGDGSNQRQLTVGFGDSYRGLKARRPRWAPDGSGIVFESPVYDVLSYDNVFAQVSHLYYIGYNPVANEVAIELADGSFSTKLDYNMLVANQTIKDYRLTSGVLDRNHTRAMFLEGRDKQAGTLGTIVLQSSSVNFDDQRIQRQTIDELLPLNSTPENLPGLGGPEEETRLLAAHYSVKPAAEAPIVSKWLFYERSHVEYAQQNQYSLQWTPWQAPEAPGGAPEGYQVTLTHLAAGYSAECWDANFDKVKQSDEDRNGDGKWTKEDCYPHAEHNLFLAFDDETLVLDEVGSTLAPALMALDKSLGLNEVVAFEVPYVKIQFTSPLSAAPIPAGTVATLRFRIRPPGEEPVNTAAFALAKRLAPAEFLIKGLNDAGTGPMPFDPAQRFDLLQEATFSPDGDRLLLSVISNAQPVLLATGDLDLADPKSPKSAEDAVRVDQRAMVVRAMDWVRQTRFYPCGWVGGYQHLADKSLLSAFRGGLDELKLFSGLRDSLAFRSEAERGHAGLKKSGQDGLLPSKLPGCGNNHLECPAFHLCIDSECAMVPCDPSDPWTCAGWGGRCTLRPEAVEQEYGESPDAFAWVCSAECNTDQQCLLKQCANGPCRFCDGTTQTCVDCREGTRTLGALTIATVEGCPDEKSFSCDAGTCVSECYQFDDEASSYLCDPSLEYCQKGRCQLHDWTWWDFAPATFSGGAGMRQTIPPSPGTGWNGYTQAVDQKIPITITAYGVDDYLHSPELLVEVSGGPFYGANWHRVGRVQVHHRSRVQAYGKPYGLFSPHPFGELRLRMVTMPYLNVTGAATGLGEHDDQFCVDDLLRTAKAAGETPDVSACYQQAQGSRYINGYEVGIPFHEMAQACVNSPEGGCPVLTQGEHDFLMGGNPAAVVLDITVDGAGAMNSIVSNPVCTYEGNLVPVDNGLAKKVFYGNIATERSNEKTAWCKLHPEACANGSTLVEFNRALYGHALLNCNVYSPTGLSAGIYLSVAPQIHEWPATSGAIVLDNGDVCQVEVSSEVVQPCHAWLGGDVTVDSNNAGITSNSYTEFQNLEFGLFRNFAHEEGFERVSLPTAPLRVCVLGYQPGGGLVLANEGDLLAVDGAELVPEAANCAGLEWVFSKAVKLGKGYTVTVLQQPADPETRCLVRSGNGAVESDSSVTPAVPISPLVQVLCGRAAYKIGGTIAGATGQVLLGGMLSGADGTVLAIARLSAGTGAFDFGDLLPASDGDAYLATLLAPPLGQQCTLEGAGGTVAGADVASLRVSCLTPPSYQLGLKVSGLEGQGLSVKERGSNQNLACAANGVHLFSKAVQQGAPLDLIVSQQPLGPDQVCSFSPIGGDDGPVMPGQDLTVNLVCTTIPLHSIGGKVMGLLGSGLTIALNNQETMAVITAPIQGEQAFRFQSQLKSGEPYTVSVVNPPTNPMQQCEVGFGSGTVGSDNVTDILIICSFSEEQEMFTVGGTVTGLKGTGLKLNFKDNAQLLDIKENGSFTFKNKVPNGFDYKVAIGTQPQDPMQNCVISNGTGKIQGANVTSVNVDCYSAASLTVTLTGLNAFNGSLVDARLYSLKSKTLVGVWSKAKRIKGGQASYALMTPGPNSSIAGFLGGSYVLYVRVDAVGGPDPATGLPLFDAKDVAAVKVVNIADGQAATAVVGLAHFGPMSPALVIGKVSGALEPGALMRCFFALEGLGPVTEAASLPISAPVVSVGSGGCTSGCQVQTNGGAALAEGKKYDINCWVDNDGNGKVDFGDWLGEKRGVSPIDSNPLDLNKLLGPVEIELKMVDK